MSAGNDKRKDFADSAASSGMDLRRRAEGKAAAMQTQDLESLSPEEAKHLVHELRVHQIELEMQNEELRRTQQELEASHARYFDLYDLAPVGYVTLSEQGTILEANLTAATMLGAPRGALVNRQFTAFILPADQDIYYRHRKRLFEKGEPQLCELGMVRPDGNQFWALLDATAAQDGAKGAPLCRVTMSDITERKKAQQEREQSEKKYGQLIETMNEGVWAIDKDANITLVNPRTAEIMGYTVEEMTGKPLVSLMDKSSVEFASRKLECRRQGVKEQYEGEARRKDGTQICLSVSTSPVTDSEGGYAGSIAVVQDITERKKAEKALLDSEERFRFLTEQSLMGVHIIQNGKVSYANKASSEMCGYSIDEITNWERNGFARVIHPDDLPVVMEQARRKQAGEKGTVPKYQWRMITRSGEVKWIESWSKTIMIADVPADFVTMIDITERKRMEEALRTSQERLSLATEGAGLGIWNWNIVTGELIWNDKSKALFGIRLDETMSYQRFVDALHPDDREKTDRAVKDALDNHKDYDIEYRSLWSDGSIHWLAAKGHGYYDATGKAVRMEGVVLDLAQRKRAEEALRESERRFRAIFDNANDGFVSVDVESRRFFNANRRMMEMLGYESEEEIENLTVSDIHPEKDPPYILGEFEKHTRGEISRTEDLPVKRRDGSVFYASVSSSPLTIGEKTYLSCIFRDITERNKAEEELRESETHYRLLAENLSDVIWTMGTDLKYTYVSTSVTRLRGYSVEEAMAQPLEENLTPASVETAMRILAEEDAKERTGLCDPNRVVTMEVELSCKDGSTMWAENKISYLRDSDGRITGYLGVTRDITERRKAEEALRESEEKFRAVFMQSPIGIVLYDQTGAQVALNKACREIFGLPDAGGIKAPSLLDDPAVTEEARQRLNEGKTLTWEGPLDLDKAREAGVYDARRHGKVYVRGMMLALGRGNGQAVTGYLALLEDVTERKRVEEALRESEGKFRAVFMQSPIGLQLFDAEGKNLIVNPACLEILGAADPSEIKSLSLFDFPFVPESAKEGSRKGESVTFEVPYDFEAVKLMKRYGTPKSGVIHLSVGVAPVRLTEWSDRVIYYLVQVQDVTERKQAEEKIKRQLLELQRWHNVTLDREGRVRELKQEVNELLKRLGEPGRYSGSGYGETETPLTEWGGKETREQRQRP